MLFIWLEIADFNAVIVHFAASCSLISEVDVVAGPAAADVEDPFEVVDAEFAGGEAADGVGHVSLLFRQSAFVGLLAIITILLLAAIF